MQPTPKGVTKFKDQRVMGRKPFEEESLYQDKKEVREEKLMSERSGAVLAS